MRRVFYLTLLVLSLTLCADAQMVNNIPNYLYSGNLGVGRNVANDANVYLQVGPNGAATRGVLLPRVADTSAITGTKRNGLLIYSNQLGAFAYFDSTQALWRKLGYTDTTVISTKAYAQKVVNDTAAVLRTLVGSVNTRISGLQAANGTNTIDNAGYKQEWKWNNVLAAADTGLVVSSDASYTGDNTLMAIRRKGSNGVIATTKGLTVDVGLSGSNGYVYGIDVTAGGGASGNIGVRSSVSNSGTAIYGYNGGGNGYGVYGISTTGSAIYGDATGSGIGGYFTSSSGLSLYTYGGAVRFQYLANASPRFVKHNALGQLYGSDTLTASGAPISGLTAATGTNTIDNADYNQTWQWNSLTGDALTLSSTSTAGASNNKILEIIRSGANGSSSIISHGIHSSVTNTGTSSTNYGGYFSASGATTNTGVYGEGATRGVLGATTGAFGDGVRGTASTGSSAVGVSGTSSSASGKGVVGQATGTSGTKYGGDFSVTGTATTNYGVSASATGGTTNYGIRVTAGISSFDESVNHKYVSKTADYTADATDYSIFCDATSAAITITLPAAAGTGVSGRVYIIKKTDASGNNVTVDGNASETIDGATTYVMSAQYKYVTIQSNGTNWFIIGNN